MSGCTLNSSRLAEKSVQLAATSHNFLKPQKEISCSLKHPPLFFWLVSFNIFPLINLGDPAHPQRHHRESASFSTRIVFGSQRKKGPKSPQSRGKCGAARFSFPGGAAQCSPLQNFTWILWLTVTLRFPRQRRGFMTCSSCLMHKLSYGGKESVRCPDCCDHVWILMDFVYPVSCTHSDSNTTSSRGGPKSLQKWCFFWLVEVRLSFACFLFVTWHHHGYC